MVWLIMRNGECHNWSTGLLNPTTEILKQPQTRLQANCSRACTLGILHTTRRLQGKLGLCNAKLGGLFSISIPTDLFRKSNPTN